MFKNPRVLVGTLFLLVSLAISANIGATIRRTNEVRRQNQLLEQQIAEMTY